MRFQSAIVAGLGPGAHLAVDQTLTALRSCVARGSDGVLSRLATSGLSFACLRLPSNKVGERLPLEAGTARSNGVCVVADAYLLGTEDDPARHIAALYREGGTAALDALDGDFAVVLHDENTGRTFARRDPFGVRPLYWVKRDDTLVLCSLPDALVAGGCVDQIPDPQGVLDIIRSSANDKPRTFTKGLQRVPPNTEVAWHADGTTTSRKTWHPDAAQSTPSTFESFASELRERLRAAVADRLPPSGDLAASVSSGLDSTTVVKMAERCLQGDQHIFASTYGASRRPMPNTAARTWMKAPWRERSLRAQIE